jgi:hypothetical protein
MTWEIINMTIGCLTGNGKNAPIGGSYAFLARGINHRLQPDLIEDKGGNGDRVPFTLGSLTDGDLATAVGWQAGTVFETGVDIAVDLTQRYFVDRVVLHQALASGRHGVDTSSHIESSGLSRVEIYAVGQGGAPAKLVAQVGHRGPRLLDSDTLSLDVGVIARQLIIRLIPFEQDIALSDLEIWGASSDEPTLFPVPVSMEGTGPSGSFDLSEAAVVIVGSQASEDSQFAAQLLAEKVGDTFGISLPVRRAGDTSHSGPVAVVGKPGECELLGEASHPVPAKPEAYSVEIREGQARVLARDRPGLVYGVETLLQLLQRGKEGLVLPCLVEDYPRMEVRGVHFYVPAREQIPFVKRLIRHVLVPMKINTIFLELAGGMLFERRPEIAKTWEENNRKAAEGKGPPVPHGKVGGGSYLTQAEVKDLLDYARSYGLEVIPEIQSLSHVEYLTMTYPEIAEQPVDDGYPDSYCPLHPKSREIVFDMIDEVLEVFGPLRYIHMGHDEVYTMGVCERCRGKSRAELYAQDVTEIHDYLTSKGVGMMLWADMLQPFRPYSGPEAIDMIPKDIVMLEFVWYFRTMEDTEDRLLDRGFKVILGNAYSSHFPRFESRSAKRGVIGAEVSAWTEVNEDYFGRRGKLYDFIYSANTMWSQSCQDELRWTFDRKISELMPTIRRRIRGQQRPSQATVAGHRPLHLADHCTAPMVDATGYDGGYDLSMLPRGLVTLKEIPFHIAEGVVLVAGTDARHSQHPVEVTIPIADTLEALVFLQTCTTAGTLHESGGRREPLGHYHVRYRDGSMESIDVAYGYHLAEWDRRHAAPLEAMAHRHYGYVGTYPADPLWQGKTPHGEDITLYGLEWVNPHPGREIEALSISAAESRTDTGLIVVAITGIAG